MSQTAKSILIVEGHNDKAFLSLLLQKLELNAALDVMIEDLHKFEDLEGNERRGKEAIGAKLKSFKRELEKKYPNVEKIGVILDFDDEPHWDMPKNLTLVNTAFEEAFGTESSLFPRESELVQISESFSVACFFNKDSSQKGNLDTLLYEIRQKEAEAVPYADCLEHWRDCVNKSTSLLKVKDNLYGKIWLGNFLRAKAREDLGENGKSILRDFEAKQSEVIEAMGSKVFDLEHPALAPLYQFLQLFKNNLTPT